MNDGLEKKQPENIHHRALWQMGYNKAQRDIIIEVARKIGAWPRDLGAFCMSGRAAKDIENLNIVIPPTPWYARLWSWVRYAWHWVTSWRFELRRKT